MLLKGLRLLNESDLMEVPNKYPIENPLDEFYQFIFFFQAEDGIRDVERSRGLGDVYKRQPLIFPQKLQRGLRQLNENGLKEVPNKYPIENFFR